MESLKAWNELETGMAERISIPLVSIHDTWPYIAVLPYRQLGTDTNIQTNKNTDCFDLAFVKGKGFPLQAWNGSCGSTRLRLLDLLDFRHYEGGKVVTLTHRPSLPPEGFLVLIFRGWVDPRAHVSVGNFGKNLQRCHRWSIPRPSDQ